MPNCADAADQSLCKNFTKRRSIAVVMVSNIAGLVVHVTAPLVISESGLASLLLVKIMGLK